MTTSTPLWESRSTSFWQKEVGLPRFVWGKDGQPGGKTLLAETDLCIVGGGIAGNGAGYFAKQRGIDALILDAREPALGASGRNAGMVLSGIADSYAAAVEKYGPDATRELWQLSIDNREMMLALADEHRVPYTRCGSWLLADNEEEADLLAESHRLLDGAGFAHEYSPEPPLGRDFLAGLYRPADSVINPAQLVSALSQAGPRIIHNALVTGLEAAADGRVRVISSQGTVLAQRVLLVTNAYSTLLHPYFADKIRPCRGQIQVSEPAPMIFREAGYSHFGYYYYRQIPLAEDPSMGRWLMGGARHLHFETENDTFDDHPTDEVQNSLVAYTARYFPELADVPVAHRWAGTMGFTADGLPIVGSLPDLPQVTFCVGFNGHGMGLGVKVVERAIAFALDGKSPGIFGVERLGGN
jgi:glycine/D-amino acid oxidase-like deaminating enzyme